MGNPIIKLVDISTGKEIEREMNDAELTEWEADQAAAEAAAAAKAEAAAAKAALLARLGITEEEAKLLLS